MSLRHNQYGFTLVESVVALVVSSMLIAAIMVFTMSSLTAYGTTTSRAYLLDQAQLASEIIVNDIRLSASADQQNRIDDPYAPDAPTDPLSWASDSDTLILATAVENEAGEILFADPSQYISHKNNSIYYLEGGSLYKRILAAPVTGNSASTTCPSASASSTCRADRRLLDNVENFTVHYLDGNNAEVVPGEARSIELTIRLKERKFGRDIDVEYTTRMVFRND